MSEYEADIEASNTEMTGSTEPPPRLLELLEILQSDPMLIPPILSWAKQKQAEIADAKGRVLYGDQAWEAMKQQLIDQSGKDA